jgi:hypothetical protein
MKSYEKVTAALFVAWFVFALSASALQWFRNDAQRVGLGVAAAALIPLVIFAVWFGASEPFRRFTLSLNPRILTFAQTWRLLGIVFVVLEARNVLPALFALPAGYGDIFIGATAWFAATRLASPKYRNAFIFWQALGITDLVMAVSLGTTARLIAPSGPTMLPLTVLPLSLVPTFLVPLFLMIHVISIAQARKWGVASDNSGDFGKPGRAVA